VTAPADIEQIVAQCQATDMRLARVANGVNEAIAATERAMKPRAVDVIERHPGDVRKPVPAWLWRAADWLLAFVLGFGLAYSAAQGF
jgi:hypothetical protein